MKPFLTFLLLCCFFLVSGQEADRNGAYEFWSRFNLRIVRPRNIQHDFEFQYRNQQRVASVQERFQLYTFRWYIQKRWNEFYLQSSPVTFFERRTNEGMIISEYRLTQNVGWFLMEDKFQIRSGLEGRFFWSQGNHFEEIRWRLRLLYLIPVSDKLNVQLSDEIFFHERTSGIEVPFFDQNRTLIGINYKLTTHLSVDSGYQFQVRSFTEDHTDNFNVFYFYFTYQL